MSRAARRPRPALVLAALWLLVFAVTSQTMILAPILPRIAEQLRVSEARLSIVATGYAVAVALVAVVSGPVSDRVGRRRMLLAGAGAMTVTLAAHALALALGLGSLLAARVLTGAAGGVLTGATGAYIGDYFPPERRGWANGWVMSGMAAGQVLGIPLGTVLAARWGFRFPFLAFAAAMALAFAMVWAFLPQPEVERRRDHPALPGAPLPRARRPAPGRRRRARPVRHLPGDLALRPLSADVAGGVARRGRGAGGAPLRRRRRGDGGGGAGGRAAFGPYRPEAARRPRRERGTHAR